MNQSNNKQAIVSRWLACLECLECTARAEHIEDDENCLGSYDSKKCCIGSTNLLSRLYDLEPWEAETWWNPWSLKGFQNKDRVCHGCSFVMEHEVLSGKVTD